MLVAAAPELGTSRRRLSLLDGTRFPKVSQKFDLYHVKRICVTAEENPKREISRVKYRREFG